jgi:hypothetical protein
MEAEGQPCLYINRYGCANPDCTVKAVVQCLKEFSPPVRTCDRCFSLRYGEIRTTEGMGKSVN